jgi:hypothetical protein
MSSPTTTLADSDVDDDDGAAEARFFAEVAPFLFLTIKEDSYEDDDESQGSDSPDSNDEAQGPEDGIMTLDESQAEAVRDVAGDAEFLEEIGLTPQAFTTLLDGTDIEWSEDEADRN